MANNHEFSMDFEPFSVQKRTKVTVIMKTDLCDKWSKQSNADFLAQLCSDLRSAAAAAAAAAAGGKKKENLTLDPFAKPKNDHILLRQCSSPMSSFAFEARITKGPPGVGFGMIGERAAVGFIYIKHY